MMQPMVEEQVEPRARELAEHLAADRVRAIREELAIEPPESPEPPSDGGDDHA